MADYQPQIAALWEDLKQLTKSVVEEMNRADDLSNRTGGLECRVDDSDAIVVSKQSLPRLYVTIRLRGESIDVYSRLVVTDAGSMEREVWETLTIQIDHRGSSLRTTTGDLFTVDQAVYYILRPFLHLGAPRF